MGMENVVKLSRTERAKFIYLFKILKNQGDEDYDYDNLIKALQNGYELHYSDVFECLYDEELNAEGCREVLDILEMYRGIIYSYNSLKQSGKIGGKQMSYTDYFIKDLDRYAEIEGLSHGYYNSHCPMLHRYRSMLEKWETYKALPNRYMMNEQQIVDLLKSY